MSDLDKKIYKLKQIETHRLIIRPVQLGDEFPLNKAVNNSLELLQKWQPWAKNPRIEVTRDFIRQGVFAWESCSVMNFPMVVIHKLDNKIIGASGYNDRSDINKGLYEIGYWCEVDYQGKGYITECVNALTRYALNQLDAKTVVIIVEVGNVKSMAVAERLNFINHGTKPSVIKNNAADYYFTCEKLDKLPVLDFSWSHHINDNADTKIIAWAKDELKINDKKIFAGSKVILKTPWSSVMAINTGEELVYLKHMPENISLEAAIIKQLKDKFNAPVPEIIANNIGLNCFLMKDSGQSLRTILKQKFDIELVCKAINQFTLLQLEVAENLDVLFEVGVPDWRLSKLPDLYRRVILKKDLLMADGLSELEVSELESLCPKISKLCDKLSEYNIKQTIVQPDFSDHNTLIDDNLKKLTIIDLGEIVISHPFFSLLNWLQQMKKHYGLVENDDAYLKIEDACFYNYKTQFESKESLLDSIEIADILWIVYSILATDRLMLACGQENILSYQPNKFGNWFRVLKDKCESYKFS